MPHTEGCWYLTLRGVGASHRGVLVPHTEGCWYLTQRGVGTSHRGVLVPHTEGCWCLMQWGQAETLVVNMQPVLLALTHQIQTEKLIKTQESILKQYPVFKTCLF